MNNSTLWTKCDSGRGEKIFTHLHRRGFWFGHVQEHVTHCTLNIGEICCKKWTYPLTFPSILSADDRKISAQFCCVITSTSPCQKILFLPQWKTYIARFSLNHCKWHSNLALIQPWMSHSDFHFFFPDVKSTLIWIILYFHVYSISFSTVVFMFVACCYSVLVDCFCEGSQQCVWQWHSPPRVAGEPLGSWKSWKMVDCWVIVEWSTNDQRVFGEVGTVSWQGMETRDLTHEYSINNIFFFFFLSLKLETVILRFI